MTEDFKRIETLALSQKHSCFLWGPRQVGKTTLLRQLFPDSSCFNLLDARLFAELHRDPGRLQDRILALMPLPSPVVIDEVQKIPALLDVVQLLIDEKKINFVLCGSSARKLKRSSGNLLGGRALRCELHPLSAREIGNFDLLRALNHGLLPRHYLSDNPRDYLQAYVGDYLREEIMAEALVRNSHAFSRFLEVAAISNGEMLNHTKIASECGVRSSTVREYFQILEDTLIGHMIPSFRLRPKRRVIHAPKFYYFDLGLVNFLLNRGQIQEGSELFGRAFEHFIFQEIMAHRSYSRLYYPLSYWRTASDLEVDFVLGQADVVVEVKGKKNITQRDLRGLTAFREEYTVKHALLVSLEDYPRTVDGVRVLPWKVFLDELWSGNLMG